MHQRGRRVLTSLAVVAIVTATLAGGTGAAPARTPSGGGGGGGVLRYGIEAEAVSGPPACKRVRGSWFVDRSQLEPVAIGD